MTEQRKDFPDFYLTRQQPCPYLPDRQERKLFTHLTQEKSQDHFDFLHADGFRRSQTIAYRPHCENCTACISVRVRVDEFQPTKSQKRVWRKNRDLIANRTTSKSSDEQYSLFQSYVETRHNDGGMADMTKRDYQAMIEDSVVDSFLTQYHLEEAETEEPTLIGASLCDHLSDGISLVYSFFDPNLSSLSLGTYMILETIDYAKTQDLPYVYLGYWVKGSPKMDYKARYLPQDQLINGEWLQVTKTDSEN